jgi:DNA-binding CsgD family transcriptional regulator
LEPGLDGLAHASQVCGFSPAQDAVWRLAAQGHGTAEIARQLGITERAVHQRFNKIRTKLIEAMRVERVRRERERGYRDGARQLGISADGRSRGRGLRRRLPGPEAVRFIRRAGAGMS